MPFLPIFIYLLAELHSQTQKQEAKYNSSLKHIYTDNKRAFGQLSNHRKYLIAELLSFFPVNPVSETECAIINIKLPNESSVWPDLPPEALGAALGYIVHMLNTTILYLDICLPYKMHYTGSRSTIWREGST